jgi:hypothetical protein
MGRMGRTRTLLRMSTTGRAALLHGLAEFAAASGLDPAAPEPDGLSNPDELSGAEVPSGAGRPDRADLPAGM